PARRSSDLPRRATGTRATLLATGRTGTRARTRTGLGSAGSAPRTRRATGTRATLLATGRTGTRARTRTGLGSRLVRAHAGGVGRERVVPGARTGRTRIGLGSTATATLLTALRTPCLRAGLGRAGTRSLATGRPLRAGFGYVGP